MSLPAPLISEQLEHAPDAPILIAGGGIGGLAAAIALAQRGFQVHVLEQRHEFAEAGAGIQIGPNGTKSLSALGVADLLRSNAGTPEGLRVVDGTSGATLARLPLGAWIGARHGAPYWTAHRQDLHAALLARARQMPRLRITMGASIASALPVPSGIRAEARSGTRFEGRALIAADGLWSQLRARHFAASLVRFAGKCAYRAVVPRDRAPEALRANETCLWLAPSAHAVHYPVRAGRELAVVVIVDEARATEDWNAEADVGLLRTRTAAFASELRHLVAAAEGWRRWSLHTCPVPRQLAHGRMALVGDAAHPVLPFLAQGGVLALEDAIVLADALALRGNIDQGLADYGRLRRRRVARVARASRTNGHIYHLSGPAAFLRDALLRSRSPDKLMAAYDWLYGWTP